jgi:hypothetical protein
MLEICVRSFPRTRVIWFAERAILPSLLEGLALHQLLYHQVQEKPTNEVEKGATVSAFTTLLIDLTSSEDLLWNSVHKSTRQEIKFGATRLPHDVQWFDADPDFRLYDFMAGFCAQKKLWLPPKWLYVKYIAKSIVSCCYAGGKVKVLHFYLLDGENRRVRLLWSARALEGSETKANIARLNKLLHWEDLLYFRNELKMLTLDWGGIALTNNALRGVDDFKRRFGGTLVTEWNVDWRSRPYAWVRRPVPRRTKAN